MLPSTNYHCRSIFSRRLILLTLFFSTFEHNRDVLDINKERNVSLKNSTQTEHKLKASEHERLVFQYVCVRARNCKFSTRDFVG